MDETIDKYTRQGGFKEGLIFIKFKNILEILYSFKKLFTVKKIK